MSRLLSVSTNPAHQNYRRRRILVNVSNIGATAIIYYRRKVVHRESSIQPVILSQHLNSIIRVMLKLCSSCSSTASMSNSGMAEQ